MVCLFFSFSADAKFLKDDFTMTKNNSYSWQEVCKRLTRRESPLIEYQSIHELDCMGTKVDVMKFCEEIEVTNPFLARAVVKKDKKVVNCQSGRTVIIKWQCQGREDKYCKDPEVGCFLFQEKLAKRLKIIHQSMTDKKYLNCYFDVRKNSKLIVR